MTTQPEREVCELEVGTRFRECVEDEWMTVTGLRLLERRLQVTGYTETTQFVGEYELEYRVLVPE